MSQCTQTSDESGKLVEPESHPRQPHISGPVTIGRPCVAQCNGALVRFSPRKMESQQTTISECSEEQRINQLNKPSAQRTTERNGWNRIRQLPPEAVRPLSVAPTDRKHRRFSAPMHSAVWGPSPLISPYPLQLRLGFSVGEIPLGRGRDCTI